MTRRDWLLLLIGDGLDPIRIQKGMFLFAMESPAPAQEKYAFVPYNWGPFSQPIYGDLESLQRLGLVEREPVPNASYFRYRRTSAGDAATLRHERRASHEALAEMRRIQASINGLGFNALLKRVYRKYPQYASKSLFSGK